MGPWPSEGNAPQTSGMPLLRARSFRELRFFVYTFCLFVSDLYDYIQRHKTEAAGDTSQNVAKSFTR